MQPTILLTRPADGANRFASQIRQTLGQVPVILSPLLKIKQLEVAPDISAYDCLIFTSVNSVEFGGAGRTCYSVGEATAKAARAKGMQPVGTCPDAKTLIRRILADRPRGRLLHLRGKHSSGNLAETLSNAGLPTDEVIVYDQVECQLSPQAQELLNGKQPVIVPLFSPRTARIFAAQARGKAPLWGVAISQAAADALGDLPDRLTIADTPDATAMLNGIQGLLDATS